MQKVLVDDGLIVKAMRDSDWTRAQPVKATMTKTDFTKQDDAGNPILNSDGDEQCETKDHKLEQIKCDFEAKKIECTEELRLHNNKL